MKRVIVGMSLSVFLAGCGATTQQQQLGTVLGNGTNAMRQYRRRKVCEPK